MLKISRTSDGSSTTSPALRLTTVNEEASDAELLAVDGIRQGLGNLLCNQVLIDRKLMTIVGDIVLPLAT